MRKISRTAATLTASLLASFAAGHLVQADEVYHLNQNQTGFNLPGVTLPQGQDEVRAADGTTCRSAVSGAGAYFDIGVIRGTQNSLNDLATYGRVVIPIGQQPKRLDCSRLYELEVQRLQMELKLLKMGLSGQKTAAAAGGAPGWAEEGWSDKAAGR